MGYFEITDLSASELDIYARLSENQLNLHRDYLLQKVLKLLGGRWMRDMCRYHF